MFTFQSLLSHSAGRVNWDLDERRASTLAIQLIESLNAISRAARTAYLRQESCQIRVTYP
jgi:hypothetical protein